MHGEVRISRLIQLLVLLCLLVGCRESSRSSKQTDELLKKQREERAGLHDDAGPDPVTFSEGYADRMCECVDRACADEIYAEWATAARSVPSLDEMPDDTVRALQPHFVRFMRCYGEVDLASIPDEQGVPKPPIMQKARRIPPGPSGGEKPACTTPYDQSVCMQEWAGYYRTAMCACPDRACGEPLYLEMKQWLLEVNTADYQSVLQLGGLFSCISDVLATDPNAPAITATKRPTCSEGVECYIEWQTHWTTRVCACRDARDAACAQASMAEMSAWMETAAETMSPGDRAGSRLAVQQVMDLVKQMGSCMFGAAMYSGLDEHRAKRGAPNQRVRRKAVGQKPAAPPACTTSDMTCMLTWFAYHRDEMCACSDRACADARDTIFTEWFIQASTGGPQLDENGPDAQYMNTLSAQLNACREDAEMTDPNAKL
jgi:hypothetical protein